MTEQTPTRALEPCPFCGAGETQIHVNKGTWRGHGYGEPVSVEVRHWCTDVPGQPSRMISRAGRDEASAIAAWNTRAKWGSPVVAGEPWGASVGDRVWVGKLPTHVPKLAEEEGLPIQWLYTTPQPTQAQAGAVPLTVSQIRDWWASENGLEDCEMCKITDFLRVVRAVEEKHGIKEGGQHG